MKWPSFFPTGCPTPETPLANESVYRVIEGSIPTNEDFISFQEQNPQKCYHPRECDACGISVYTILEDVVKLQRRVPKFKNKRIAIGKLTPEMGMLKPTPGKEPSHHSWWIPLGIQPLNIFVLI
ncbi:MAG: hypothetical protein WAQ98_32415 [Blastocatellia bacterium]